jgi:hypothetical protein
MGGGGGGGNFHLFRSKNLGSVSFHFFGAKLIQTHNIKVDSKKIIEIFILF